MTVKKWLLVVVAVVFVSIGVIWSLYQSLYNQRFFQGIKLNNFDLSGKTFNQALIEFKSLSSKIKATPITIVYGTRSFSIPTQSVDLEILIESSLTQAWQIGRRQNPIISLKEQAVNLIKPVNVDLKYSFNQQKLNQKLKSIAEVVEKKPVEPKFKLVDQKIEIEKGMSGKILNQQTFENELARKILTFSPVVINLQVDDVNPSISSQDAAKQAKNLKNLIGKKIILSFQDRSWEISDKEVIDLITLTDKKEPLFELGDWQVISIKSANSIYNNVQTQPNIDQIKLTKLIENIASEINEPARNALFVFEAGKVTTFQPSVLGKQLNKQELSKKLVSAAINDPQKTISIAIPVAISEPAIKTADVNNLGIKELIGKGTSNFVGSAPERIHNIKLASSRINGTLISPGETFSFNQTIGEISAATGYTSAYIISKGRTILGEGGGVCQVSTTTFRAAVYSGLPIVKRNAHAYRVSYYEQGGHKVGLDATIYVPTVDLRFKNDTGNYILIQSYTKDYNLYFDFYGTNDGRQVTVTRPKVTNVKPPPEPLYEEDPTLPVGVKKQVDFAATGASVTVKRKVVKNGQVLHQDTFFSRYRPWQAIFKVGTGRQQTRLPIPGTEATGGQA